MDRPRRGNVDAPVPADPLASLTSAVQGGRLVALFKGETQPGRFQPEDRKVLVFKQRKRTKKC